MRTVLRWREEPFDCEFIAGPIDGTLRLSAQGDVVWEEPIPSAAAACLRAREIRDQVLSRDAQRA